MPSVVSDKRSFCFKPFVGTKQAPQRVAIVSLQILLQEAGPGLKKRSLDGSITNAIRR